MIYPKEFVDAVKKELPCHTSLHKALDEGSDIVGRILDESSQGSIEPNHVAYMIEQGRYTELRAEAEKLMRLRKLYRQWLDIMCTAGA